MKRLTVLGQSINVSMSPSFIQNSACPFYLKCRYVDRVDEKYVRVAAERGSAAHHAIATLTQRCQDEEIQPDKLTDEDLREAVADATPAAIMSEVMAIFFWVKLWSQRFKFSRHIYGFEEKIALDDEFEECAWDNASYRSILDMIDIDGTHCTITDYKSHPRILTKTELDEHEQLTMYSWIASKLYPDMETFSVRIWYLRYGFYAETSRTLQDLELFEHSLMIRERKIAELNNWEPIPGKHCQYCEYIHLCPLSQRDGLGAIPIITQDQAVEAGQRIVVLESYAKELKEKLKVYVNLNDDVRISEKMLYGFKVRETKYWDAVDVQRVLDDFEVEGHNLAEVTNIDKRKMDRLLKDLAKDHPDLEAELAEVAKVKRETRFEGYSPKGESDEADAVD